MRLFRVLILCEYATLNGGERSLLAVVGHLAGHGFLPSVAAPPDGPLAAALKGINVRLVPLTLDGSESQSQRRTRLRSLCVEQAPDLVHANSLSVSRLMGPIAAELRIPSVGHLRDIMRISSAAVQDLNRHSRLLAVSTAVKRWYTDLRVTDRTTAVLHNGIDLRLFQPRPRTGCLARELRVSERAPLIGSIGQVGLRKGLDVLAASAAIVRSRRSDVQFLHAGVRYSEKQEAIDYECRLRRTTGASPLAGHFHWLGLRQDVPSILNEVSLLVHAARQEPLGRVLLEAAAAGVPVVATDVGGTNEIFPARSGAAMLVPTERPGELADAILHVLADETLRARMAVAARQIAEARFDARDAARELARHYQEVLAQQNGLHPAP